MRSGGTFCPQNEHDLARPHFGGRAKQKKAVAGLSISKESAPTLPLLVMSRFPFSLETSSTSTLGEVLAPGVLGLPNPFPGVVFVRFGGF